MNEDSSFGTWMRQRRRALDLTQQELAKQAGCAPITIRRIEGGELKPSKELALVLLGKLEISEAEQDKWVRFARGVANQPSEQMLSIESPSAPSGNELPTGTVAFLYCDLVGFTPRYKLDPDSALDLLAHFDQLLHPIMEQFSGKVFNIHGDNFTAAFTDPLKAVEAAIYAKSSVKNEDWGKTGPIQITMALHVGQAKVHPGGRYVSISLAYLEPLRKHTPKGEIILSQAMADAVRAHLPKNIQLLKLGEYIVFKPDPPTIVYQLLVSE